MGSTFWSSFKELDFVYDQSFQSPPFAVFDNVISKNWDDTDAYRIGLTYDWNDRWTTTLGFAYDRTPVPANTLGFELPDTDAMIYCTGIRYRSSAATEWGFPTCTIVLAAVRWALTLMPIRQALTASLPRAALMR